MPSGSFSRFMSQPPPQTEARLTSAAEPPRVFRAAPEEDPQVAAEVPQAAAETPPTHHYRAATHQPGSVAYPREPPRLTAAAAEGLHLHRSPTSVPYYHFYSDLPSNKMNSFVPRTATSVPRQGKATPGVAGVRQATDSMALSTLEVASE